MFCWLLGMSGVVSAQTGMFEIPFLPHLSAISPHIHYIKMIQMFSDIVHVTPEGYVLALHHYSKQGKVIGWYQVMPFS